MNDTAPPESDRQRYREKIARITLDSMVQFVGLLDATGNVLEINRVALDACGLKLADVEGRKFWDTFWWQVTPEINALLKDGIRRAALGEVVRWDTSIYGRAGGKETIVIDASLCPVFGADGQVDFIAAEGRDITEKKAQEVELVKKTAELEILLERVKELDRLKTQFFANVSHEFRTPLTLMLGPLEDSLEDAENPLVDAQRARQELIVRNAERLLKLVNTLLDFSRIEAGKVKALCRPTALAEFTSGLVSVFRSSIEKAGMMLVVDAPPLGEPVHVDREMWEKIVLNLVSNAFKFTFAGEIHVTVSREGNLAVLRVKDSGTGIPVADLPNVFQRFHRVQGAKGRTHEGSGIGLALVQELVHFHGGTVSVHSTVDEGSEFVVQIPFGSDHLAPESRAPAESHSHATGVARSFELEAGRWIAGDGDADAVPSRGGARILVADDNPDLRRYLKGILSRHWSVDVVHDGEAALISARVNPPDLILSDVMMPGLNGIQLIAALKKNIATRGIPVILLSARAGEEAKVDGLASGADDYLIKPFSAKELVARVRTHLKIGRLKAESDGARIEAERANELKSLFLANMSHEIRTPLGAMLGFADLLRDPGLSDEERANYLEVLHRNGETLSVIVNDILDLSKVEAGHLTLEYSQVSPRQVGDEVLSLMSVKASEKGLWLEFVDDASTPKEVVTDATRLRQILVNLVGNAIKFTRAGSVTLKSYGVMSDRGVMTLCFEVTDSGIGIPESQRDKIFEMFVQGDGTVTRRFGGMGLGLALSRRLARALRGDVSVLASQEGFGTTFLVRIEHHPVGPDCHGDVVQSSAGKTDLQGVRVLIVDDALDNRALLKKYLTKQGAVVETEADGAAGCQAALAGDFDVVLMDIQMPVMDGYTATQKLRALGYRKPIIALTAHAMSEIRTRALNAGYTDHLPKPINQRELIEKIAAYVVRDSSSH